MPAKRRTKRKQTKTGGSIRSLRATVGKAIRGMIGGSKKKIYTAADHARMRQRKLDPSAKFPKRAPQWFPMPQVIRTPHGLINVNPPKPKSPPKKRVAAKPGLPVFTRRGGNLGLAKWGIGMIPDVYKLAASGVGSQGGRSAGSRAAYTRYGPPLLSRYR